MNETVYLVGLDDPKSGRGYVSAFMHGAGISIVPDYNLARIFDTKEDAVRFTEQLNHMASFNENFKLRYSTFEYKRSIIKIETDLEQ